MFEDPRNVNCCCRHPKIVAWLWFSMEGSILTALASFAAYLNYRYVWNQVAFSNGNSFDDLSILTVTWMLQHCLLAISLLATIAYPFSSVNCNLTFELVFMFLWDQVSGSDVYTFLTLLAWSSFHQTELFCGELESGSYISGADCIKSVVVLRNCSLLS